jgi:hypothetical protein
LQSDRSGALECILHPSTAPRRGHERPAGRARVAGVAVAKAMALPEAARAAGLQACGRTRADMHSTST